MNEDGYEYISVGRKCDGINCSDTTGDNISAQNANFCELTALYWIWKNANDLNNVGLCHYRRFFGVINNGRYEVATISYMNSQLSRCDIILPKAHKLYTNYYKYYEMSQHTDALSKCCQLLEKIDPSYKIILNNMRYVREYHCFNMFYAKKKIIDKYCEWLFNLLFEFEKQIDISEWSKQQQRVFGYLSEFLLNLWIKHEHLIVSECEVVQTEVFPCGLSCDATVFQSVDWKEQVKLDIITFLWPLLRNARIVKC